MAENREPTTREMIRGTLSHEVRGLLINLGLQLANFDKSVKDPSVSRGTQASELERAKNEIRPAARTLSLAVDNSEMQLSSTNIEPRDIFSKNDLITKARALLSKTSRVKDLADSIDGAADHATLVHRTALNIERMIKISNSLFGDEETAAREGINPTTILKDIEVSTPPGSVDRVAINRPAAGTFLGYRRELISAASNLVRNGLRYSRPEELSRVSVELSAKSLDELRAEFQGLDSLLRRETPLSEEWISLRVSDTGKGIPKEHIGAVFKPFVRLDSNGKPIMVKDQDETLGSGEKEGSGQGFGLTLVKRVAELHEGVAVARSGEPFGMVFAIIFPLVRRPSN